MAIGTLTPSPVTDDVHETHLEFPDNRVLIDLCGEYDRNLAQVEHKLGVQILRRGNMLAVVGEAGARQKAAEVLEILYAKLEAGRGIDAGEIDGAIRLGGSDDGTGTRDGDQIEMFDGGHVEIKTRKKTVEPRTAAQKGYVQALFQKELAFGIGPAGTGKTYLAVAVGVNMFIGGHVDRIILSRPAVVAG